MIFESSLDRLIYGSDDLTPRWRPEILRKERSGFRQQAPNRRPFGRLIHAC